MKKCIIKTVAPVFALVAVLSLPLTAFADAAGHYEEAISEMNGNDFNWLAAIIISLVIGIIIGFIVAGAEKSKLKSVAQQKTANTYMVDGSLNITDSREVFLYKKVDRTAKPQQQPQPRK